MKKDYLDYLYEEMNEAKTELAVEKVSDNTHLGEKNRNVSLAQERLSRANTSIELYLKIHQS